MSCCKSSCPVNPQLCVDASIFVPENECTCYATAILFNQMEMDPTFDSDEEQINIGAINKTTIGTIYRSTTMKQPSETKIQPKT